MSIDTWFLFLLMALAAIACPGPAIVLAVSNALNHQIRTVLFQAFGNLIGLLVVTSVVILGLGNLLDSSPEIFGTVKFVGAGCIIYIGMQRLLSSKLGLWRRIRQLFHIISAMLLPSLKECLCCQQSGEPDFVLGSLFVPRAWRGVCKAVAWLFLR